ncbi:MAG TPA: DUF4260 domain-containing protein [Cyclobacteriaceae bacterium]|nr:DUF4260 domain-containing protein [Cyclobacteriaceae bacterium]
MKNLLRVEELGQFVLSIFLFSQLEYAWWIYPACLLLPDFSMLGYAVNTRIGAWMYNFFHHKALGIAALILGFVLGMAWLTLAGVILFGHAAMDRVFGYGLKFSDSFQHTHLGWIGKKELVQKTH